MAKKKARKKKKWNEDPLTDRQRDAILFIRQYYLDNDNLPSVRTIQRHMGYKSSHSVTTLINVFVAKRWIEKVPGAKQYRFYRGKFGAMQQEEKRKQLEQGKKNDNSDTNSDTTIESSQSIFLSDVGSE